MLQLILTPDLRIVVIDKIEQSSGRPSKYLVEVNGSMELWEEAKLCYVSQVFCRAADKVTSVAAWEVDTHNKQRPGLYPK